MNLCFINPSAVRRPEIYGLAEHLPRKNNITILQPSYAKKPSRDLRLSDNILVKHVPCLFFPLGDMVATVPSSREWAGILLNLVRHDRCDLIHVCDYDYLTSLIPVIMKRRCNNIPMTITNDALIGVDGYSFGSLSMDFSSKVYTYTLGKKILEHYDRVIILYPRAAEMARRLGLVREKIVVVPNGVDVEELSSQQGNAVSGDLREKYGICEDEKVILFVGRLVSYKRVEIVISVVAELLRQGYNVKALIVGEGVRRSKLERMAFPIRNSIIFTGYLSEERYECYRIADLFFLPSLSEGLPNVLLEAGIFELPIVATNTGGIPSAVIHGKTGFLAEKDDLRKYFNYIRALLSNEMLAREMGRAGRRHIEQNFSWSRIVPKYEELFNGLVKGT